MYPAMDTFLLPSAPSAGPAVFAGGQGSPAPSQDAASTLQVRFEEVLACLCSACGSLPPALPPETTVPGKDGGSEERGEPALPETVDASVLLSGVAAGMAVEAAPTAGEPVAPADGGPVLLSTSVGSGGVTAEAPEPVMPPVAAEAPGAAAGGAAGAFPAPRKADASTEGNGGSASAAVPGGAADPFDGTQRVSGAADRFPTGGEALPDAASSASTAATAGPRAAVTAEVPSAAPSKDAHGRIVQVSSARTDDAPPAASSSAGKPAPASGEDPSGTAVNLTAAPETAAAGAPQKKRGEASIRNGERVEPPAPASVPVDRVAADKASAPRAPAPAPAAPHEAKQLLAGENAFVLTRKSDTSVEVTLSPPGVGKLEMEIVLEKGVVNANITAADPAGREAIERSLPQIIEALARDGMAVGGFTVSLKERREQAGNAQGGRPPRDPMDRPPVSSIVPTAATPAGLVDLFV